MLAQQSTEMNLPGIRLRIRGKRRNNRRGRVWGGEKGAALSPFKLMHEIPNLLWASEVLN